MMRKREKCNPKVMRWPSLKRDSCGTGRSDVEGKWNRPRNNQASVEMAKRQHGVG
jgi:hypothetical protein